MTHLLESNEIYTKIAILTTPPISCIYIVASIFAADIAILVLRGSEYSFLRRCHNQPLPH